MIATAHVTLLATLLERMSRLQLLGFIETQPNGKEQFCFIFLPKPHAVLFAHQAGQGAALRCPILHRRNSEPMSYRQAGTHSLRAPSISVARM